MTRIGAVADSDSIRQVAEAGVCTAESVLRKHALHVAESVAVWLVPLSSAQFGSMSADLTGALRFEGTGSGWTGTTIDI